jgi:hypothetical protein
MIYTSKIAFIHIPKTSGMSVKRCIEEHCPDAKFMPEHMFNDNYNGTDWRLEMHYSYAYWEHLLDKQWVFSIVRNPYVRAVSFYLFLKNMSDLKDDWPNLVFEDIFTEHFQTQTQILTGKNSLVPNIFKFEDSYEPLEKKLGFKIDKHLLKNKSYNYADFYNPKRIQLVYEVFEEDFKNFGYNTSFT